MSELEDKRAAQVAHMLHGVRPADDGEDACEQCGNVRCTYCTVQYTFENLCRDCYDNNVAEHDDDDTDWETDWELYRDDHDRVNDGTNQPSSLWKYWKRT